MNGAQVCPVPKLEKLLLATDGSEYSEGAIREAISFAKRCSSKLYAMFVVGVITDYEAFSPQKVEEAMEGEAKKHLESVRAKALSEGVVCEIILAHGEPHERIVEEAERIMADLIFIGRRGRKGLAKALMGEVAAKVIGHTFCNVLVVPRAAHINYKTVLVAVDGSKHSEAALQQAIAIAKRCGSSLIALSAMRDESEREEAEGYVKTAVAQAQKEGVQGEGVTPTGRSFNAIVETAGGKGVDLIVMGTYGKTGIRKMLMGSSTEKVISSAGCAVLVIKGEVGKPSTV